MNFLVGDCKIIFLDKIESTNGSLTVLENNFNINFDIKRVYYLYDIPGGESRGAHAHKELEQFVVAASGSFSITLDDGETKKTFILNRPNLALNIKPGIWRDIFNFSSGAICLVLASMKYQESDYIRDYNAYLKIKKVTHGH
uniref:sugar 3,4-ketoisomerase n=1 Tax=Algoriphagus sp. TaxID=1872435 RepID=UPI0040470FF9